METKYRDIADGNDVCIIFDEMNPITHVGNQVPRYSGWKLPGVAVPSVFKKWLETKYRDIADGNKYVISFIFQ